MNGYLLDTNILSGFARRHPADAKLCDWLDTRPEQSLFVSVLTLGELRKGASLLAPGRKRAALELWLETELPRRFATRILPVTHDIATLWGSIRLPRDIRAQADAKSRLFDSTHGPGDSHPCPLWTQVTVPTPAPHNPGTQNSAPGSDRTRT